MKKILLFCKIYGAEVIEQYDRDANMLRFTFLMKEPKQQLSIYMSFDEIANSKAATLIQDRLIDMAIDQFKLDRRLLEENDEYQAI